MYLAVSDVHCVVCVVGRHCLKPHVHPSSYAKKISPIWPGLCCVVFCYVIFDSISLGSHIGTGFSQSVGVFPIKQMSSFLPDSNILNTAIYL